MKENEKFRAVRLRLGFNQKEMAGVLGVIQSSISDLETGESKPTKQTKLLLKCLYNLDLAYWDDSENQEKFLQEMEKLYISKKDIQATQISQLEYELLQLELKELAMKNQTLSERVEAYERAMKKENPKFNNNEKPREKK